MPRRKVPDDIPLADNLDSAQAILGRARSARQDDLDFEPELAFAGTTVITTRSRLVEMRGDEEGLEMRGDLMRGDLMWWS